MAPAGGSGALTAAGSGEEVVPARITEPCRARCANCNGRSARRRWKPRILKGGAVDVQHGMPAMRSASGEKRIAEAVRLGQDDGGLIPDCEDADLFAAPSALEHGPHIPLDYLIFAMDVPVGQHAS